MSHDDKNDRPNLEDPHELAKWVLHYYGYQPNGKDVVYQWLYKLAHAVHFGAPPSAIAPPFKLPLRAEHIPYEGTWFYDPDGNDVEHEVIADFINKNFGPTDGKGQS